MRTRAQALLARLRARESHHVGNRRVPVGDGRLSFHQLIHGTRAEAQRRDARRAAQGLLRARIRRIHAPLIEIHWDAGDRRDEVADEQAIVLMAQVAHAVQRLTSARGRFSMHQPKKPRLVLLQGGLDFVV